MTKKQPEQQGARPVRVAPNNKAPEADANMELWRRVHKTPKEFTKEYSGLGGYSGTSINPHYLIRLATEQWGPMGDRWGFELEEERFDTGPAIAFDDQGNATAYEQTHTVRLSMWYPAPRAGSLQDAGHNGRVWAVGHTPYVRRGKNGVVVDGEYYKKSVTDAQKKCLSLLGFAADVWLGQYDDVNYLQALEAQADLERRDRAVEDQERAEREYMEWLKKQVDFIETSTTLNELIGIYKSAVRKAENRQDQAAVRRLATAYEDAKARIEGAK